MASGIYINGLPLPSDLLTLIHTGRWKFPDDLTAVKRIFPVWHKALSHASGNMLYTLDYMPHGNQSWPEEKDPMFIGAPDPVKAPGDIDPKLSVIIGDLGHGSDQPIALDYRSSMDHPRVLTLEWSYLALNNRWIEVAPNIQSFAELLGL
jgi:hypothetical protein